MSISRPSSWSRQVLPALSLMLGLAAPACGAIAGVPEEPRPGILPGAWLAWSNDSFGGELGQNSDDFRTNAVSAGARIGDHWLLALDYSMMTHLENFGAEKRSDELTATIGCRHDFTEIPRAWIAGGAGIRVSGDLGGEGVQNAWHDLWGYEKISVRYEDGDSAGVAYAAGGWAYVPHLSLTDVLDHRLGIHFSGALLASTAGELQGALSLQVAVTGRDAGFWVGLREQFNSGDNLSDSAAAVADHEKGTWLMFGTGAGTWYFEGGVDLYTQATVGRVGFQWRRGTRNAQAQVAEIEGTLGLYEGYALGLQYRWRPHWLDDLSGGRAAMMLDYRFGQYPGVDWQGNIVVVRQPLFGIDVALTPPRDGFHLVPFAYLAAGVREESVEVTLPGARFPRDDAVRAVVQSGIGLRCYWGTLPTGDRTARYGISLVYDIWQPFGEATVSNGFETVTYQERHSAAGVRLATTVAW